VSSRQLPVQLAVVQATHSGFRAMTNRRRSPELLRPVVELVRPMPARDALLVARIDRTHRAAG